MIKLTFQEKAELIRHKIPLSGVFDASGYSISEAKAIMQESRHIVMVNSKRCAVDPSHLLRNRHGKCVECNPAVLAFQARKSLPGYTYLASSKATGFHKIGMSEDVAQRHGVLNHLAYGGANDWQVSHIVKSKNAGLIEHAAQLELWDHFEEATYIKDGRRQRCIELFRCPAQKALMALRKAADAHGGVFVAV